jgi:hypothetical protein
MVNRQIRQIELRFLNLKFNFEAVEFGDLRNLILAIFSTETFNLCFQSNLSTENTAIEHIE